MSGCGTCACDPVGTGSVIGDGPHIIINIGDGVPAFVDGTGPNPFEFRTFESSDSSINIEFGVDDETLDFTVVHPEPPPEAWQVDVEDTISTDSDTFVTFVTMAGDAKVLDGEEWQINMGVLICEPYALAGQAVNAEQLWLIETATGVFTEFDRYSTDGHITITGDQKSSPRERTKKLTASMDEPRMRLDVRRSTVGNTAFFWEDPRWGGNRIEPAPPEPPE